jgi:hypothetical protein
MRRSRPRTEKTGKLRHQAVMVIPRPKRHARLQRVGQPTQQAAEVGCQSDLVRILFLSVCRIQFIHQPTWHGILLMLLSPALCIARRLPCSSNYG